VGRLDLLIIFSPRVVNVDCRKIRDRMSAWLDQELSPGEGAQLEGHLSQCSTCATLRDRLQEQSSLLALLPPGPHPGVSDPSFWNRMDADLSGELDQMEARCLDQGLKAEAWRERRVSVPMAMVVAYAAVLILAVWWGWEHSPSVAHPEIRAETVAEVEAMPGSAPVALRDGPVRIEVDEPSDSEPRLKPSARVTVPPELIRSAAYLPHRGTF
jgi:anti-sigma factor RsiW